MKHITIFLNFNQIKDHLPLKAIIQIIRSNQPKPLVQKIRIAQSKKLANQLKKKLPAFTVSGKFIGGRSLNHLEQYLPYIVLDLDQIPADRVGEMKEQAIEIPYTKACFISPSGQGLKVLIQTTANQEDHASAFNQVADYYEGILEHPVDRSGKDITRLCFFSWDPDAYHQDNPRVFEIQAELIDPAFQKCLDYTDSIETYQQGNRNNYIYLLASNCNHAGLSKEKTLKACKAHFDLGPTEIQLAVESAYLHHQEEHAKVALKKEEEPIPLEEWLAQSPMFPNWIYKQLPSFLKDCCSNFHNPREKDTLLTSLITILSGCMNHISGVYHGRTTKPNLYALILAPAASGKSVLTYARASAQAYHQALIEASQKDQVAYQAVLRRFQVALQQASNGASDIPEEPQKPPFKMLFIPANTRATRLIQHLQDCDGKGILCETEADTMGVILKQDWGSYSDLLRKAFSGESISISRRAGELYQSIDKPKLSVLLSGTPNQLLKLIPSAEDGLFSRFLFYTFFNPPSWKDVSPKGQSKDLDQFFESKANELLGMVEFWDAHPIKFHLTSKQWDQLNQYFRLELPKTYALHGAPATATIKRLGNILFRIAMVLTALRQYEASNAQDSIFCQDSDFKIALAMIKVYLKHALILFDRLPTPKCPEFNELPNHKQAFLEELPKQFKRKEAVTLGKQFGMGYKTVDRLIKSLIDVMIKQLARGTYEKI